MSEKDPLAQYLALRDHIGTVGNMLTPVEYEDACSILKPEPGGPRRHWIGRAKGYNKTRSVAGMSLSALLTLFPSNSDQHGYVAASDADQAGLIRQSIRSFVDHTPGLAGEVVIERNKITAPRRGTELYVLAADTAGSHGLRPLWLVVDELANWRDEAGRREFFDSLWAGLPKVPGSSGIVITTAGSPSHFARDVFEAAKRDRLWRVSDVHGPPPWADPAEIESERLRLPESTFRRLWLNEWSEADDAIADAADVDAACTLTEPLPPQPEVRYVLTLDLGVKKDRTVAVIAHAAPGTTPAGGRHVIVDRMEVWTPKPLRPVSLDAVRQWIEYHTRLYNFAGVHYDPSQALLLVEQLRLAGIRCHEFVFSGTSVSELATSLSQALRARRITLPADAELKKEILSVRLRESAPNVLRIDTRTSRQHDDRVIAVAMACRILTTTSGGGRPFLLTDEELRASKALDAQLWHGAPKAVQVIPGRGFGSPEGTAMPANVWREIEDDDGPPPGSVKRSPFV